MVSMSRNTALSPRQLLGLYEYGGPRKGDLPCSFQVEGMDAKDDVVG